MNTILLLSSPTCIPCKILASRLDKENIKYEKLNALEHPEYNVMSTPHIIIKDNKGNILKNEHVSNINDLISFIKGL